MSLYRIYGDDAHYLNFVIPGQEVIKKLGGRDYPFHIDRSPKPYSQVWKEPLQIDFYYGDYAKGKTIPDIAENGGRLYFSEPAYKALHKLMEDCGEFLPVIHRDGKGYIFNPLKTAEEVEGIDGKKTVYDVNGNLESFSFHEKRVKSFMVFRTKLDTYLGIFCQEAFKRAVEDGGFTGINFGSDLSNPLGTAYRTTH
ncbi:MAG: hypothetical protein L0Z73_16015 [Gammaproteobacteria bacterium]|nr:hypothetical protein [Gammaproteobacteria bacterium]